MIERLLTIAEVAEVLHVSRATVYELIHCGRLVSYRVGSQRGAIRIRPSEIDAYLRRAEHQSSAAKAPPKVHEPLKHITLDRKG